MKNFFLVTLLSLSMISFAQKNELKEIKKLVKAEDYQKARSVIDDSQSIFASTDEKYKSKYDFFRATIYFNLSRSNPTDFDLLAKTKEALKSAHQIKSYTNDIDKMNTQLVDTLHKSTVKAYESKDWSKSMKGFEMLYRLSPKDTIFLYSAASVGLSNEELYGESLEYYKELLDIDYNGGGIRYIATNKTTKEEEAFTDKFIRDTNIKLGTHENPRDEKEMSKKPEIIKNIALILVQQGKEQEALKAVNRAIEENPNDSSLILSKANLYYNLGDTDNYKKYILEAITKDPKNADLYYNVGVANSNIKKYDEAITYYKKALEINPKMVNAVLNASSAYLEKGNIIVQKMNDVSDTKKNKKVDWKKYDKLKEEREKHFVSAAKVLEEYIKINPADNQQLLGQLKNIYGAIGDTANFKRIKEMIK